MSLMQPVLQKLADGQFHSGEMLAKELGVSRNAIWKTINQLKKRGVEIYSIKGRGYRFAKNIELLSSEGSTPNLENKPEKVELQLLFETDSTNQYLLRQKLACDCLYVCASEWQTQGRGRLGRPWLAPMASHLSFSIGRYWAQDISLLGGMSLAAGVAVIQTLRMFGIEQPQLKWPNDIVLGTEQGLLKIGGILVEMKGNADAGMQWVVGIGLNVADTRSWDDQVDQPIIGLENIHPQPLSRNQLLQQLIKQWLLCEQILITEGVNGIVKLWRKFDILKNQPVRVGTAAVKTDGIAKGVDDRGQLLVEVNNKIRRFSGGEVKVRLEKVSR